MPRTYLKAALVALGLAIEPASVHAAEIAEAGRVLGIKSTSVADLVLLDAGFSAGLRQGMVCLITRAGGEVAQVVVVDLRDRVSAVLLATVGPSQSIRSGDSVRIKTLNF